VASSCGLRPLPWHRPGLRRPGLRSGADAALRAASLRPYAETKSPGFYDRGNRV